MRNLQLVPSPEPIPSTFTVVPYKHDSTMATLQVVHSCGHSAGYAYGGMSFAQNDGDRMAAKHCLGCHNTSELQRHAGERGEIYKPYLEPKH